MGVVEDYERWLEQAPASIKQDQLWKFEVCRHVFVPTLVTHRMELTGEIDAGLIPAISYHRPQKE